MRRIALTIAVLLSCAGCTTRSRFPNAMVKNDEHGVLRELSATQLRRIDQMVAAGVPESKRDNTKVWPDDTIWYRVYVYDGEGCYRLRYEFHPSFRKVKVYPNDYTLFPRHVKESAGCTRLLERVRPDFQPFDEDNYREVTRMFYPNSDWSGF